MLHFQTDTTRAHPTVLLMAEESAEILLELDESLFTSG
jgi:hypothetical protein